MVKIGQQGVQQKAEVTVLAEPRMQPCNQCVAKHHVCLPQVKGGQLLSACVGCFIQKLSCQTAGKSRRKIKVVKEEDVRGLGESSESDEGRDESGGRWMARLSTLKVGPPIGAKPMMGQMGLTWQHLGSENKVASQRRMTRMVGLDAKRKPERYCESFDNHTCSG